MPINAKVSEARHGSHGKVTDSPSRPAIDPSVQKLHPGMQTSPRYQLIEKLGEGGIGQVWSVTDRKEIYPVLKIMIADDTSRPLEKLRGIMVGEIVSDMLVDGISVEEISRFLREEVFEEVSQTGALLCFPQKIRYTTDLKRRVDSIHKLEVPKRLKIIASIATQIIRGLDRIHRTWILENDLARNGLVHLDIKPANIFLREDSHGDVIADIKDFSLATSHQCAVDLIREKKLAGVPKFWPPEVSSTGDVLRDPRRIDVFQLGLVLYILLTNDQTAGAKTFDRKRLDFESLKNSFGCEDQIIFSLAELTRVALRTNAPEYRHESGTAMSESLDRALMLVEIDQAWELP